MSVRDRVQTDYADQLTPDEQSWLASFNETEYGSNPHHLRDITGEPTSIEDTRRYWREIKRYQRDYLSVSRDQITSQVILKNDIYAYENTMIEAMDRESEIERISIDCLMIFIRSKNWS